MIDDTTCYEANSFDQRPDPAYGTGAVVRLAKVPDPIAPPRRRGVIEFRKVKIRQL